MARANTANNTANGTANTANANVADTANTANANVADTEQATDFTDYLPSKTVGMTMFVIVGRRVKHNHPIGIAATGKVIAVFEGEKIHFGTLTRESLQLTNDALNIPVITDDAVSNEDIVKMKTEIEKNWCYEIKIKTLEDKQQKDFESRLAKKSKQKAASLAVKKLTGRG